LDLFQKSHETHKNLQKPTERKEMTAMNSFDRERLKIQRAKMLYSPGTRIVLGEMSDPYAPVPPGTRGTVKFVDDMGTIHPQWDNGRTLGLVYGEDSFRKLTPEELEKESQTADEAEETDELQNEGGMGFGMCRRDRKRNIREGCA
jgi:hypothetical protein